MRLKQAFEDLPMAQSVDLPLSKKIHHLALLKTKSHGAAALPLSLSRIACPKHRATSKNKNTKKPHDQPWPGRHFSPSVQLFRPHSIGFSFERSALSNSLRLTVSAESSLSLDASSDKTSQWHLSN